MADGAVAVQCKRTLRTTYVREHLRLFEITDLVIFFQAVNIETPQGFTYTGKRMDTQRLCGVSVLRAGETMEPALCEVCKDIRLGKILIQTNLDTGEPEVY